MSKQQRVIQAVRTVLKEGADTCMNVTRKLGDGDGIFTPQNGLKHRAQYVYVALQHLVASGEAVMDKSDTRNGWVPLKTYRLKGGKGRK